MIDDILQRSRELAVIFCTGREQMLAAERVLKEQARQDQIAIVGFGFDRRIEKLIKEGTVAAAVDLEEEKTIHAALEIMLSVFAGEAVDPIVTVPHKLITRDSLE